MKPLAGPDLIVIKPALTEREEQVETGETKIEMSALEKENQKKEQNRGTIVSLGVDVNPFWKEGDFVSFYKGATTTIRENGIDYLTIHKGHVLVKFVEE
jgi:co-chaperonin GroES (HSP10)